MFRSSRLRLPWTRFVAGLGAFCAAAAASASALQTQPPELNLGEVRSSFARVDAEADGRLDRRQADSGGVSGEQFEQFDANADGLLDAEEFLVARQALAARSGRSVAADLGAESTRIQAAWRARRAPGPSARVDLARRSQPAAQPELSRVQPTPPSRAPEVAATRAAPAGAPTKTGEGAPSVAPGLGLSRLSQGAGVSQPQRNDASLEERARSAQELILARRKESGVPAREPVVVGSSRGPASRTTLAEKTPGRASAPSTGRTPRTQQAPPSASGARPGKPRSATGNGGN